MLDSRSLAISTGLVLVFAASSVQAADWRRVAQLDAGGTAYYLDVDSPRRDADNQVVAVVLAQHSPSQRTPDGNAYASSIRVIRFGCAAESLADQSITFYAEAGGNGAVVRRMERTAEQANADLQPTDPQSIGKALVYAACEVFARGKPAFR
ncbi:hypothetical protein M8A51_13280 [Schlegelella sp. S2-27]|uniref:Surface-adhesin protein E-like domain-containing protein n=1 Tax=Caldimonas mangrovi TaxID=2944811 RepID=A0ABT0YP54_9BURK|nr:surface-adhesin E family protein [Caldimonas mangrovi]MCM5680501.1 hypothetical protein [Caldimonas mangrovi]